MSEVRIKEEMDYSQEGERDLDDVRVAKGSSFCFTKSPAQATSSSTNVGRTNCFDISPFAWSSMPPLQSTLTPAIVEKENVEVSEKLEETYKQVPRKRKAQQRFSIDIPGTSTGKQTFGTKKKTGEMKLTTNTSRKVEVRNPSDGRTIHVYKSCSECARSLHVNRSKLSRCCRSGGGLISLASFITRYV